MATAILTPRTLPTSAGGERECVDRLVAGTAARALAQVRRHQLDPVGAPGRARVAVEEPHPPHDVARRPQPRDGDVRTEPPAVHGDARPARGRAGAGREPVELGALVLVELEPGPEDPRVGRGRERAAAGDAGVEGGPLRGGPAQALDQVVERTLGDVGEERQRDVHLLGRRPAEVGGVAPHVEEGVEVLDRLVGRLRPPRTSGSRAHF